MRLSGLIWKECKDTCRFYIKFSKNREKMVNSNVVSKSFTFECIGKLNLFTEREIYAELIKCRIIDFSYVQFTHASRLSKAYETLGITRYVNSREPSRNTKGSRWTS